MKKPWDVIEDYIYESFPIFSLKRSKRLNPFDEKPQDFLLIDGKDWCQIVAITDQDQIVLVRQYRQGSQCDCLELPGGCVEPGESPETAALRELSEESGYGVRRVQPLGSFHPNPALMSLQCHAFVGVAAHRIAEQKLLSGEKIEVVLKDVQEIPALLKSGQIQHGVVMASLALYLATIKFS